MNDKPPLVLTRRGEVVLVFTVGILFLAAMAIVGAVELGLVF